MGHCRAVEQLPSRGIKGSKEGPGTWAESKWEQSNGGVESWVPMEICRVCGDGGGWENMVRDEQTEHGSGKGVQRMRGWYGSFGPLFHSVKVCSHWSSVPAIFSIRLRSDIPGSGLGTVLGLGAGAPLAGPYLRGMSCGSLPRCLPKGFSRAIWTQCLPFMLSLEPSSRVSCDSLY